MKHNYHTHTVRCGHAFGTEREIIENAIKKGFETFGFSDHAPYIEPIGSRSLCRMHTEQIGEYFETIRKLKKEYEKDINILCGFELEYHPEYHKAEMEYLKKYSPDYLILGQHFVAKGLELTCPYGQQDDSLLKEYVSQALEGLETGDFLYFAHPDLPGYTFSNDVIEREYYRLCLGAKRMDIPLEINLLGLYHGRWFSNERFFKIAVEVGNKIVFGLDVHSPEGVLDEIGLKKAEEMVNKLGLNLQNKLI